MTANKFKTGLYVDCHSLWHGVYAYDLALHGGQNRGRPKVDYKRLMDISCAGFASAGEMVTVKRAYVPQQTDVAAMGFTSALRGFGYEVKTWATGRPGDTEGRFKTAQRVIEEDLGSDRVQWNGLVLVTQDIYFIPVLKRLQASGARVMVAGFNANYSMDPFAVAGINIWELGTDVLFHGAFPARHREAP